MTPQELKNSILQLAIQGKLVEQRAEEGTGRELLEKILAAKNAEGAKGRGNKLTRSRGVRGGGEEGELSKLPEAAKSHYGKLSALSASPREEIPDDEKPFDIPESWEWVHINQVADTSLGKTMDKVKNTGDFRPYLCSINVYWDGVSLEKIKEARFTVEDKQKYLLKKGDLLICEGGDVGRSAIWNLDKEMYYQNALHRVRFYDGVIPQYFRFLIECYKWLGIIERYCKGVTIKHLVQKSLYAIYFPLPPLAEQKRIVAKIEELLPLIDRYEKAWSRFEDFNKRFPVDMQKSILQMAIQGKLVEQRAEEGTGRELLEKILAAKNAKDAEKGCGKGRLTRSRGDRGDAPSSAPSASPRDEISDDEKPFDIPESWEWVRLGTVIDMLSGFAFKSADFKETGKYRLLRGINLSVGVTRWDDAMYVDDMPEKLNVYRIHKGDVLIGLDRPWISDGIRVAIFDEDEDAYLVQRVLRVRETIAITKEYIALLLRSNLFRNSVEGETTGISVPHISPNQVGGVPIPLPPLAEQKRIVAKIEELLPLCDRLK